MRSRYAIAVVAALLAVPATGNAAPGTLDLRQTFDGSRGVYVEGTLSYVRVRGIRGKLVVAKRTSRPIFRMQRRLGPGRYTVISYQRPCAGNCGMLDPPTDRCARRVRVLSGGLTEVAVHVRPGRRCTMSRHALPARFPPLSRVRAVQGWLRTRSGSNSWALVDSWGRMHSFAPGRVYVSASLVKAMLLVAYLRGIRNRAPDAGERASLGPMITASSNDAADTIYYRVGDAALNRVARLVGMRSFSWPATRERPLQRAGPGALLQRIDRLVPRASRATPALPLVDRELPALGLLALLARGRFKTFFKGGWRGTGAGQLVHEAALFERGGTRISMAVLTDGTARMTTGPRRCAGSRSACSDGFVRRRSLRRTTHRRRAGRLPPAGRDWWTSIASGRASA